jgi:hypothetical protein
MQFAGESVMSKPSKKAAPKKAAVKSPKKSSAKTKKG